MTTMETEAGNKAVMDISTNIVSLNMRDLFCMEKYKRVTLGLVMS